VIVVVVAAVVVVVVVAYSIPLTPYSILHSGTYVISRWGYSEVSKLVHFVLDSFLCLTVEAVMSTVDNTKRL
jgi:L-cystine uptake protein TcyP (sodium:dicarboxylate symporter family)